jgi:hypothetical protein
MVATDPSSAKTKGGEFKTIIKMWDATFKELAAVPAKPEAVIREKRRDGLAINR